MNLFEIRGKLSGSISIVLQIVGIVFLFFIWWVLAATRLVSEQLLPSPIAVIGSLPQLHFNDALVRNLGYSMYLNVLGYVEAILICLPIGFIIGMFPFFRGLLSKQVDAIRFIPLTAVTGIFIAWFGIDDVMKVQFLAFGIIVYLLPVVVQRVEEVPIVYQQTAFTLGASRWQQFTTVFFPHVIGQLINDVRVLVAISWTYIIVAEMLNKTGGIGGLLFTASRQGRMDKVFALLFVIILVGFIQDKIFEWFDRVLFPYKYS
jgi:NitT/TauT family transport system permease protein